MSLGQNTLTGVVVDKMADRLYGCRVVIRETSQETTTNKSGQFSFVIDETLQHRLDTMVLHYSISFIGYRPVEVVVNNPYTVAMLDEETAILLSAVEVVGYSSNGLWAHAEDGSSERETSKFKFVKVFYGTDREHEENQDGQWGFGGERHEGLRYGSCDVTVPNDRRPGSISEPSYLRFEFSANLAKHFTLANISPMSKRDFLQSVDGSISRFSGKNAFVFIHGYNVSFHAAALRTAQMAVDLKFEGAPIFYSWPSRASLVGYLSDEETIQLSQPYIENFLEDILANSKADNVYLIGHSMGTRGLTRGLISLLNRKPELKKKLREVVLAAADINVVEFRNTTLPGLMNLGCGLTLYASDKDIALKASNLFHFYSRAGQSGPDLVVSNGLETIDASNAGMTDMLGHSYFADTQQILRDMQYLIQKGKRAAQRSWLKSRALQNITYWAFEQP